MPSDKMQAVYLAAAAVVVFFFPVAHAGKEIGCYVDGSCALNGDLVDIEFNVDNAFLCWTFCNETDGCLYFTYSPGDDFCYAFATCDNLTVETCPDCQSGDVTCTDPYCYRYMHVRRKTIMPSNFFLSDGACNGKLVNTDPALSQESCRDACIHKYADQCEYFTFYDGGPCMLFSTCELDTSCAPNCVWGTKNCPIEGREGTHL